MSSITKPTSQSCLALVVLATLILSPCLGLGGGVAFLSAYSEGAFVRWRSLGSPPAPIAALVAGDTAVIYVATEAGPVYRCESEFRARAACWLPVEPPYTIDERSDYEHSVISGDPPPPPGEPVETLYVSRFYAEQAIETRYALLADGQVWVWRYETSGYFGLLALLVAPVLGLGLGLVLIVVLVVVSRMRRRRAA